MGMPITVEVLDRDAGMADIDEVFSYFSYVDDVFSTYKTESEVSRINRGEIEEEYWSTDMKTIFTLAEETKKLTDGYFDILRTDGTYDPSGIVKGWAISNGAEMLRKKGFKDFYIDAGGDIEADGKNADGGLWRIGIRDPFDTRKKRIVKAVAFSGKGLATSGTYLRGEHIYNPHKRDKHIDGIVSLSVIGPNAYEADRFATAAFAMGKEGIYFIERLAGFEGYIIDKNGIATETSGWGEYVVEEKHD